MLEIKKPVPVLYPIFFLTFSRKEMLDAIRPYLDLAPYASSGTREQLVMQTLLSDDDAKFGEGPAEPMPRWLVRRRLGLGFVFASEGLGEG